MARELVPHVAGKLVRRGCDTFAWTASWSETETTRANEQVAGGEAEICRARRRHIVRGGNSSCGTDTCRVRQRLVLRGRNSLCGTETCRRSHPLARDFSGKPPTGRRQGVLPAMVSTGIWSSFLCWILAITLSMVFEDSTSRVIILPSKGA
jgi:hypothetical protein